MINGPDGRPEPEPVPEPKSDFDPYTEDIEAGEAGENEAVQLVDQIHDLVAVIQELEADQEITANGLNISRDGDSGIVIQPPDYHGFGIILRIYPVDSEDVVMKDHIGYVMADSKDESRPVVFYDIYPDRIRRRFEEEASPSRFKTLLKDNFTERAELPAVEEMRGNPALEEWAEEANAATAKSEELEQVTGIDRVSLATATRLSEIVADCTRRLQRPPGQ